MHFKQFINNFLCFIGLVKCETHYIVHSNLASERAICDIKLAIDHTVDACEDFYGHACNGWSDAHSDPNYSEVTGMLEYRTNKRLINIMQSKWDSPASSGYHYPPPHPCQNFMQKARMYYRSCIGETSRDIGRYLQEVKPCQNQQWPLLSHRNQNGQQCNVFHLLGQLQQYGLNNVLISHEIDRSHNTDALRIVLDIPAEYAADQLPLIAIRLLLMQLGVPNATLDGHVQSYDMMQSFWNSNYQKYYSMDDTPQPQELSYDELETEYPELYAYIRNLVPSQYRNEKLVVVLSNPAYFDSLMLHEWQYQETENLINYLMLKFLAHLLQDSSQEFNKMECIKDVRNKMSLALSYLHYKHIYESEAPRLNEDIDHLAESIRQELYSIICQNHLKLSDPQKTQLLKKVSGIQLNVGNLPMYNRRQIIDEFYADLSMQANNYYSNHLRALQHRFNKTYVDQRNLTYYVVTDNRLGSSSGPVYVPTRNMVLLPLGLLDSPIYSNEYLPLLTTSLLGFLLAHEFTHALDTTGLLYDEQGQMYNISGSDIVMHPNFDAALQCMQEQRPTDAIDERLADLVGARVAYQAYLHQHGCSLQPSITTIPWAKLFFYNLAQFFCGRHEVEFVGHDADNLRLTDIVRNSEHFAQAFQCQAGTPMNPVNKCRLY